MSLKDAVREVAETMIEAMEAMGKAEVDPVFRMQILGWAGQLITACKAAPDAPTASPFAHPLMSPQTQHAVMIEKAREEFRKTKQADSVQEKISSVQTGGERMLELVGGDNDGVVYPAPADLVEGQSRTRVGTDIYVFRNGRLEFEKKVEK